MGLFSKIYGELFRILRRFEKVLRRFQMQSKNSEFVAPSFGKRFLLKQNVLVRNCIKKYACRTLASR